MPILAIYIPKKNMKLIEKWRKQVNFSKIFMAALDREVKNRSRKVGTKKDKIAMAAEHYKTRLVEDSTVLVDFGYQLGVDDVLECRLETETINKLLNVSEFDDLATDDIPLVNHREQKPRGSNRPIRTNARLPRLFESNLAARRLRGLSQGCIRRLEQSL
ncbi:MAG: hypothetical protein VB853_13450 [Pirellulales bacterium]